MRLLKRYRDMPEQVKASIWFLISGFFAKGVSVLTTPIFTRLLTPAEYGQFGVFNSWYSILTVFVSLNLYSGVFTKGLVKYEDKRKAYASSLQALSFVLLLIWSFVYWGFRPFWNKLFSLTTVQMIAMLIMIWTFSVFSFWSVSQRVEMKYKLLVFITIITTILKPVVSVFLVLCAEDKVTARILGIVLVQVIFFTGFFFVQIHQGKVFYSKDYWIHALKFNLPLIPHYLSLSVLNSADRIMIESMVGETEAGIYNLAYSLSQIMLVFNSALLQTIEPWLYQKIKDKKIEEMQKVAIPCFALIALLNLGLMLFSPELLEMFAPPLYGEALWIIPPVAMSVYFQFLYTFFAVFEFYYDKTKYVMAATSIGAVLNIILNYIFIGSFGYIAAGYTTLVCYIFFATFHYIFMRKICRKYLEGREAYDGKILLLISLGFFGISMLILIIYQYFMLRYVIIGLVILTIIIKHKMLIEIFKRFIDIKKAKQ